MKVAVVEKHATLGGTCLNVVEPRDVAPIPPPNMWHNLTSGPASRLKAFDWESLIGVKLFSAIAGIALVLAAVFFLRYSIDQGWLQPPVRVADRRHRGDRAAGRLRAEGRARYPVDRQRARRRGDRDPVRHVLRRARALEPDSGLG